MESLNVIALILVGMHSLILKYHLILMVVYILQKSYKSLVN